MERMIRVLLASIVAAALVVSSGLTATGAYFADQEGSVDNTLQAWVSNLWVQTTKDDFQDGVSSDVDTSSNPGDVKLSGVSQEPTASIGSEESWCYTSWSRRTPVTVSNAGSALTDYQVRVDITHDADMQPDFDDIRFADSDDSTTLSHWRESYTDSSSATFWVKVPSIPSGDKTIYMYYGNAGVGSASDGTATFLFYDDFEDHAAGEVPDGWSMYPGCSSVTVLDDAGNKVLYDGNGSGGNVIANHSALADFACRQKFRSANGVVNYAGVVVRYTNEGNEVYGGIATGTTAEIWNRIGGTWTQIGGTWTIPDVGTSWHVQELRISGNTVELYIDDAHIGSATLTTGAPTNGQSGFWCQYSQHGGRDEHLVREYVSQEPTASIGSEESWCYASWSRRAPVTVSNAGSALTDYQVRVDITHAADMQPDFDDIRFADSDDSTTLSHWRESYTDSSSATFWVKVPSIPSGDKTIYMYYGNPAASSTSDGWNTFEFFDDFSSGLGQWTIDPENTDRVSIYASAGDRSPSLRHDPDTSQTTNSYFDTRLITNDYKVLDGIIEYEVYLAGSARIIHQLGWRVQSLNFENGYCWRLQTATADGGHLRFTGRASWSGFGTAFNYVSANTWHSVKEVVSSSTYTGYVDGGSAYSGTDSTKLTADYLVSHVHGVGLTSSSYVLVDNIRVRKYASHTTYAPSGTLASQVWDTGITGATWDALSWDETLPASTEITFKVRASDTVFLKDDDETTLEWSSVVGPSPVTSGLPSGRYMQWQATLATSDTSITPTLHEVRISYY